MNREFPNEAAWSIEEVEPGVFSVLQDGRSHTVIADGEWMLVDGVRVPMPPDPRDWRREASHAGAAGPEHITAPMPGKVVRVLVQPGDAVVAGQGIVVVEAMKMQNEMQARRDGRVSAIRVAAGGTVSAGDVLATIE